MKNCEGLEQGPAGLWYFPGSTNIKSHERRLFQSAEERDDVLLSNWVIQLVLLEQWQYPPHCHPFFWHSLHSMCEFISGFKG